MVETLLKRLTAWVRTTFPERQVYIRSDGRVQFFTFGPVLQATMAGLSLLFLGWVSFTSVNVLFKDRIIDAKNHRYQQMQSNYESRIADLQLSYDELNEALVSAQDRFKSTADQLQRKQQALAQLFGRGSTLGAALVAAAPAAEIPRAASAPTGGIDTFTSPGVTAYGPSDGSSVLSIMPQPLPPQPRTGGPTRASFLDGTLERLKGAASAILQHAARPKYAADTGPAMRSPGIKILAEQTARLGKMSAEEMALLRAFDAQVSTRVATTQGVMRRVGINPERLAGAAIGGPLIPMSDVRIEGIDDSGFTQAYAATNAHAQEFNALFAALNRVPLTTPVHGAGFELTSDFGARVDPFTHHVAFHPGLDFGGPWGAIVTATAPGTVTFAGPRGGYGNMVEVDHGYGMRTRYGHLSSILVRVGAKVEKGAPVGKLGSTGRSTGPHVHYEVWLADVVRDPSRFIEAGRHVH